MEAILLALVVTPFDWTLVHEWLGVIFFTLLAWHQWFNRAWWRTLLLGGRVNRTWNALRTANVSTDVALALCIAMLVASSVVLSRYVLAWAPAVPGESWARLAHLACSYWLFVLANMHAGAHLRFKDGNHLQLFVLVMAVTTGSWEFVNLGLIRYMTLSVQFVALDSTTPFAIFALRHALVAIGAIAVGYALHTLLKLRRAKSSE